MTINALIELSSSEDLYQDCWLTDLPKGHKAPGKTEIDWLWKYVATQNYYRLLNDTEKENLRKHTLLIENTVPMVISNGTVLNVHHRLYLSYLIARLFVKNEVVPLDMISSIVIYPTYKLRKVYNEHGLVICKGINYLTKPIHNCYFALSLLNGLFAASDISIFLMQTSIDRDDIKKTYRDWIEDMKYIESIINKKQVYFKDKIEVKIEDLTQKITTFNTESLPVISRESERLRPIVETATASHDQIINQLAKLKRLLPMMEEPNQTSLHLSWQAILQNTKNDSDLIIHEMAHVIDFYNGGLNGVPSTSRKYAEVWREAFNKEKQKQSFLKEYAFKNEQEFFAVCNEAYFKTPELLKQKIPAIFDSLNRVFGYIPHGNEKLSTFKYLKLNVGSKISLLKITS